MCKKAYLTPRVTIRAVKNEDVFTTSAEGMRADFFTDFDVFGEEES